MPQLPNNDLSGQRLNGLIALLLTTGSQEEMFDIICRLGRETAGAVGLAILARSGGRVRVVSATPECDSEKEEDIPDWLKDLARVYGQILAEDCQVQALPSGPDRQYGLFVPLVSREEGSLALAACVAGGRPVRLQNVLDILQLIRAALYLAERSHRPDPPVPADGDGGGLLADVVDILGQIQASSRFAEAAAALCSETASRLGCRRVALGEVRARKIKVVALDQMESFVPGTRPVRYMEEAMLEALDQDKPVFFSAAEELDGRPRGIRVINRATREVARQSHVPSVLSLPLRETDGVRFVLLVMLDEEHISPAGLDTFSLLGRLAAPRLSDLRRAEAFPLARAWQWTLMRSADLFGPRRTVLKLGGFVLGLGLMLSLVISSGIVVSAPLVIEGVHSYTHTAPMDSYLVEVAARPGDRVEAGALLGRLDSTEIAMEINSLTAQLNIYINQHLQYTQEGKDAEAEIARLEAEKIEANLAWANQRLAMTELRSSVSGFLVSEDMFPRLGQPVRRGQDLFEVTDTESLRVVIQVEEGDISDVNEAMKRGTVTGRFTLTAYPALHIPFEVERIHPYAAVAGDANSFEVRGRIDGREAGNLLLRPGMEGHARLEAGRQPLLFNWTRKLVGRVRLLWWRWFG